MKKFLAMLLASVMVIAMCACAKEEPTEDVGMPNPVHECTKEEMLKATGMDIDAPEGATDVEYYYIDTDSDPIAQVKFELNDEEFCYRAQTTDITSLVGEIKSGEDTSAEELQSSLEKAVATGAALAGLHYEWPTAASVDAPAGREGVYAISNDDEGFIAWLDVVPGVLYSLEMDDATIDGLLDTAELVFVPMQGNVG